MGRSARPLPACAILLAALVATPPLTRAQVPAPSAAARPVPVRIDGVVAIVGGNTPTSDTDVILRSDVELRARLMRAADGDAAIRGPLSVAVLAAALDALIAEAVVAREAARLHASPATTTADRAEAATRRAAVRTSSYCSTSSYCGTHGRSLLRSTTEVLLYCTVASSRTTTAVLLLLYDYYYSPCCYH
jgi:hypothetical protein